MASLPSNPGGATAYGNFHNFCRDTTIPVCNLFNEYKSGTGYGPGGCELYGVPLNGGRHLRNLGVIVLDGIAILTTLLLLWRTQRKRAAVGRREMQLFLLGYIILSICEVFTIGGFPLEQKIRIGFTGAHLGIIVGTTWMLMLNGAVGYQAIDDGTFFSIFLVFLSTACLVVGTGFIALDTAYDWTGYWNTPVIQNAPNKEYALYTLYLVCPIVFLSVYFILETFLVLRVLGEVKPMLFLVLAALFFAIGQVFDFVVSVHICNALQGKIDGSLFQTFCTLMAVIMVWVFWSSITEDDWPTVAPEAQQQQHQHQQQQEGAKQYT